MATGAEQMRGALGRADDTVAPPVLGSRHPESGRLVLCDKRTLPTAEAYVREHHHHADGRTLHAYQDTVVEWVGNRYVEAAAATLRHRLQPWLHAALRLRIDRRANSATLVDFESNPTTINQALESIRDLVTIPDDTAPGTWLDGRTEPPAHEIIPCLTHNLHVPTGNVLPATPALFVTNALTFDYNAAAPEPRRWFEFLTQILNDDAESIDLLGEWFGYCLTTDTSQQKILLLLGPPRAGKGTIARIQRELVGRGNVATPTTHSLAGAFGLQQLIGKSLAVISDARFTGGDTAIVVERLLTISGEDAIGIDRKFKPTLSLRLPTRFAILTNELPRFVDASTAIASRFLVLRLTQSFLGREDTQLEHDLRDELPGILLWAITGLRRLTARGAFVQPASGAEAVNDLHDLASPVGAFVRNQCIVGAGHRVDVGHLYQAWKEWAESEGRSSAGTRQSFGRDLTAAFAGVRRRRGPGDVPFYDGIRLRGAI